MLSQLNNAPLHYRDQGDGPPCLLIHGYPLNNRLWQPQFSALSSVARLIAPDLRGHGETPPISPPNTNAYSMELLAEDCVRLLDYLQISHPVIVGGLSMGGYISLALYRMHPERVAGLILAATRASGDTPQGRINRDKAVETARQGGAPAIAQSMLQRMLAPQTYKARPDLIDEVMEIMLATSVEGIIGDLLGMRDRPESTDLLPHISVPTLIVHGMEDQLISLDEVRTMQASLPKSTLVVIPNAGHLVNLEQPDEFNQAVRNFIGQVMIKP